LGYEIAKNLFGQLEGVLDSKHVNNSVLRNCGDFSLLIIVFHVNETIFLCLGVQKSCFKVAS